MGMHQYRESETHSELKSLIEGRIALRYPRVSDDVSRRVDSELRIIRARGCSGMFMVAHDLVAYAEGHSIQIGPGCGTATGSIVSYILGVTDIDPIRYGLYLERFLNPLRRAMPYLFIEAEPDGVREIEAALSRRCGDGNVVFHPGDGSIADEPRYEVLNFSSDEMNLIIRGLPELTPRLAPVGSYDDPETLAFIASGETGGLPYIDTDFARSCIRDFGVRDLGDIAFIYALQEVERRCEHGREFHRRLADIGLQTPAAIRGYPSETRGMMLFIEQAIAMLVGVYGISPALAEVVWRELCKRKTRGLEGVAALCSRYGERLDRGRDPLGGVVERIGDTMMMYDNKAHSLGRAAVVYKAAYRIAHGSNVADVARPVKDLCAP